MKALPSLQIEPYMFMPTQESEQSYQCVWKSQIATVLYNYVAIPNDLQDTIPRQPPPVEQISRLAPHIHMLKLMDASENSAEGIGQVLESIARQAGMSMEEVFSKLVFMNGDLATCRNFTSLQSLRRPSQYAHHHLQGVWFQLGASHTLWNIATAIFKRHFGNPKSLLDTGAWRVLNALGIPPEKAFPQKKDYTLMLRYMEQVHEATILYGIKWVTMNQLTRKDELS